MKRIIILGSTGSIGESALDVVRKNKDNITVCGLSTKQNIELLEKQIKEFNPAAVNVFDEEKAIDLQKKISNKTKVYSGLDGLLSLVNIEADLVVSALVGAVGLAPMLEAIKSRKNIALANKEVLVMAGQILKNEAIKAGVQIIPVDSEHSALLQCLWHRDKKEIKKLILTASGGPFYNETDIDLEKISPESALMHPTWRMGPKVTIDSATLMNKGFEVIEASILFDIPINMIDVVVHPESIIHAMVEFIDGSVVALMHFPSMRIPIQYAISWPERWNGDYGTVDLARLGSLYFKKPNMERFPALPLAYEAGKIGGTMPAVLSAADEICVEKFLKKQINFTDIIPTIKNVIKNHKTIKSPGLEDILKADKWARQEADLLTKAAGISRQNKAGSQMN